GTWRAGGGAHSIGPAPPKTIKSVKNQTNRKPNHKAQPRYSRQLDHEIAAGKNGSQRDPGNQRRAKGPRTVWIRAAQNENSSGDQNKGEESADVAELDDF